MNRNYALAAVLLAFSLVLILIFVICMISVTKGDEFSFRNRLPFSKKHNSSDYNYSTGEIDSIDVELLSESFVITESDDNRVHIKIEEKAFSKMPVVSVKNKSLFITPGKRNILSMGNQHDARICIEVPQNSDFEQVNVELKSGSIKVSDIELKAKQVSLKSHSGSIKVESVNCDNLTAKSLSGKVKIESLVAKDADCSSISGKIQVENLTADNFTADAKSGSIEITAEKVGETAKIQAISGSVKLSLPKDASFSLESSSTTGSFNSDFESFKNGKAFENNGGKAKIFIKTVSGSVKVDAI